MKNTFAVTMTLLLALTLGGSFAGYTLATREKAEPKTAEAPATPGESAPSPNSAATGAAGAKGTTGDVKADNQGGTQTGANGAVIGAGSESGGTSAPSATTAPGGPATGRETGQQPDETANAGAATPAGQAPASTNGAEAAGAQATTPDTPVVDANGTAADTSTAPATPAAAPTDTMAATPATAPATASTATPAEPPKGAMATAPAASTTMPAATSTAATATATAGTGDAKAGATVFASNCAGCHGAAAKGGIGANLTTADGPKAWTDAQMVTALRAGKTPQRELNAIMPRFTAAQVSDSDIANIHAWIKTLN